MTEQELNEKFASFFRRLEKKYNMYSQGYGDLQPSMEHEAGVYYVPQITNLDVSVTRPTRDENAFNLSPIMVGGIRDKEITDNDKKIICLRSCIGYTAVARMFLEPDHDKACRLLKLITTQMIMRLEQEIGHKYNELHAGKYLTFKRPGEHESYFRDLEDSAAFELRLWSDTYPMIVLNNT